MSYPFVFRDGDTSVVGNSTDGYQGVKTVVATPEGPVEIWYDAAQGSAFAQVYTWDKQKVGDEIALPDVNAWPSGEWTGSEIALTWTDNTGLQLDGDGNGIFTQFLDLETRTTSEIEQVNQTTEGNQVFSELDVLSNGDVLFAWHSHEKDSDAVDVFFRIYDPSSGSWQDEVNATADMAGRHLYATPTALPDGGFSLRWTGYEYEDAPENGASLVQSYTASGVLLEGPLQVNQAPNYDTTFVQKNAVLEGGNVIYVTRTETDEGNPSISVRLYASDGVTALGNEHQLDIPSGWDLLQPSVVALSGGGALLTMVGATSLTDTIWDVLAVRLNEDGAPVGDIIFVAEVDAADHFYVQTVASDDGKVLAVFSSTVDGDTNIEHQWLNVGEKFITGDDGDDLLIGTSGATMVYGAAGNDTVWAGSGDQGSDTLFGGDGDDILGGNKGDDLIIGGNGSDVGFGGEGNDTLLGGDWSDDNQDGVLQWSEGDRDLASNEMWAGSGNDVLFGADGDDVLGGGLGNDFIQGYRGDDILYGGGSGNDRLNGGFGNDVAFGGSGNDRLNGGAGNDELYGGAGNDSINAGTGDDDVFGSAGDDTLTGGLGDDVFYFNATGGEDVITDFTVGDDTLSLANTVTDFQSAAAVEAASIATTDGILVDLGGGNSVLLIGISLDDVSDLGLIF
ncbi:hypothetical protein KTR10_00995 [Candidatus Kaiserbacteria bacterium]|nr:hypothetical protein [Candidatus Kaiserbacteria bacterium]